jgi:hypothetical protein
VRIVPVILLTLCLAACHRGQQNTDAVRQALVDYLAKKGLSTASMDINVANVKFDGDKADASVTFAAKGAPSAQMAIQYSLELKDGKWTVTGRAGADQHSGGKMPPATSPDTTTAPGVANPHGSMPTTPGSPGKMPAPEDLPPANPHK